MVSSGKATCQWPATATGRGLDEQRVDWRFGRVSSRRSGNRGDDEQRSRFVMMFFIT